MDDMSVYIVLVSFQFEIEIWLEIVFLVVFGFVFVGNEEHW